MVCYSHLSQNCPQFIVIHTVKDFGIVSKAEIHVFLGIRWPKYWSFSVNISPSSEYLGLISFRMDWLDLLVVQGTLKSLFNLHCSSAETFFFNDPADVGNLISGFPAFSKTSLYISKFMVHVLLKPGLENFEHYFTSV